MTKEEKTKATIIKWVKRIAYRILMVTLVVIVAFAMDLIRVYFMER